MLFQWRAFSLNSDQPPATGWETPSKADKDGKTYYTPPQEKKATRPRQTRYWEYPACHGSPLVRVVQFDDGKGGKPNWHQERWGQYTAFCLTIRYNSRGGKKEKNETLLPRYASKDY